VTPKPTVSIIILNWNGKQYLDTCLSSLLRQTYHEIEIIFVDNGSCDGSVEFVKSKYPGVIIIEHHKNLGFAMGVNSGIMASNGKYIATINNDAEADKDWIARLVRVISLDPDTGCCASKMLNFYERDMIDSAGIVIYQNGNAYDRGAQDKDSGKYDSQDEVFGACAGAALYKKEMLDEIGTFDNTYFAYFEDVDLSFRMHLFGWKCVYVPDAVVYHMHSATSKQASPFKIFYLERNKLWNMWKYFPLKLLILQLPYTNIHYFRYLVRFINKIIKGGESNDKEEPILKYSFLSIVWAVIRAKFSAYLKLPYIIMRRRRFKSRGLDMTVLESGIMKR
jgi:GT2 family glycosyltransferase